MIKKGHFYIVCMISLSILFCIQGKGQGHNQGNINELKNYGMDVSGVWRQVAPGMAGSNPAIFADKVDPLKLWAAPDMGNDYISTDGGKHWETTIPVNGVWTRRIKLSQDCIISDPKNNDIVLGLSNKQIYLSIDGGINFSEITSYATGSEPNSVWYSAIAHPTEAGTWYVANGLDNKYTRSGINPNALNNIDINQPKVWKITDIAEGSRTISAIPNTGMEASAAVFDIFCHPDVGTYPEMLFAATSTGLYRKESGIDWVKILDGCIKADWQWNDSVLTVYALQQINYEVSGTDLISSGGILKTTTPETATSSSGWEDKTAGLELDLTRLSINKNYFKNLVKGWFGYTNGEESSVSIPAYFLQDYSDILCDPTDSGKVYLSVWGATISRPVVGSIWATKDGGDNWFSALRLGVGFQQDAFWTTKQPGQTNRNLDLGVAVNKLNDWLKYEGKGVRAMAVGADGAVYASTIKGYHTYKYNPAADYWTSIDNTRVGDLFFGHGNNDTGAFGVIPDKHNPGEMFVLQYEASAYKSTDIVHPDYPGIVGVKRVEALIDIGPVWGPGSPLNTPITMASHPTDPDVFYAMSARTGEISKITNQGKDYTTMGEPIEVPDVTNVSKMKCIYWSDLTIAEDGKTMYAVAEIIDSDNKPMGQIRIFNPEPQKGIYKTTDEGKTWNCLNSGIPMTAGGRNSSYQTVGTNSSCVKALVMDPTNDSCLYAAVRRYRAPAGTSGWVNGGLYRTADGSNSWYKSGIPTGIKSVWDVWLHTTDNIPQRIYIAGGGEGKVSDWGEGGVWVAEYKADGSYKASDWKKIFHHPFTSHIRTSYANENHILVATRESSSNDKIDAGTFYSLTGGSENDNSGWTKFNTGRGGMRIGDLSFDTGNPNRVWCACEASGAYTALIRPARLGDIDSICIKPDYIELEPGEKQQLNATIYPIGITPSIFSWKSLNEDIATVSENGEVTMQEHGQAYIVVSVKKGAEVYGDTCLVSSEQNTGINTNDSKTLRLYPNPVSNVLNISTLEKAEYKIHSLSGKLVCSGIALKGNNTVSLSHLHKGMYIVQFHKRGKTKGCKIVVE